MKQSIVALAMIIAAQAALPALESFQGTDASAGSTSMKGNGAEQDRVRLGWTRERDARPPARDGGASSLFSNFLPKRRNGSALTNGQGDSKS